MFRTIRNIRNHTKSGQTCIRDSKKLKKEKYALTHVTLFNNARELFAKL